MKKKLSPNMEDYLEAITLLSKKDNVVRVRDISKKLGVSKPSVHSALHTLKDNGYITHDHYGYVRLTKKGKTAGEDIYNTHQILIKFLTKILNVNRKTAKEDACKIEHNLSKETLKKLVKFVEKFS